MQAIASEKLTAIGCTVSPKALVRNLPLAHRQLVQIARALLEEYKLVIFDEPTAVLTATEVETPAGDHLRQLRDHGMAVLYISHRLDEVESLADRVTVLRDGKMIGTYPGQGA